jgi:SagB-type dehydrogenase family enzyme
VRATLSLGADVRIEISRSSARAIKHGERVVLESAAPRIVPALRRLAEGRYTYEQLSSEASAEGGVAGLRVFHESLSRLIARGWLAHRVGPVRAPVLTAIPLTNECPLVVTRSPESPRLSRFAFVRRDGLQIILESPTAAAQVVLHDWRAMLIVWTLAAPVDTAQTARCGVRTEVRRAVIDLLWSTGFLTVLDHEGSGKDERASLSSWEFHDLLFHSRTRLGRNRSPYGVRAATTRKTPVRVSMKERDPEPRLPLPRANLVRLRRADWTLTRALENRRSARLHGAAPITRRELGEFLYRSAAARTSAGGGRNRRVYPGGGAVYPLELYLVVRRCRGLTAGFYRYDSRDHDLLHVSDLTDDVRALLGGAAQAARAAAPQVLVVIAARFPLMSRKYASISYALILKEAGTLLQTMCLVATAMGLAACAIGGGDADVFARAARRDYYEEGSVAELILGRRSRSRDQKQQ